MNIKYYFYLLIIAWLLRSLNTLGFSLPGWGSGVIEPTSTKPNPTLYNDFVISPCLSNPAARPIGLLKFKFHSLVFLNKTVHSTILHAL